VVRPTCDEALGRTVRLCSQNGLPLTVRGAGTNLSGGTVPLPGGVVVATNGLNRILEINSEDMVAVVEPGVVTAKFAAAAQSRGLFYPPDPGSQSVSTLGGNVAENAGGLRGLKYGVTRDYVMGLQFFDVSGGLIKTGSRTVKCATGYNLAGLLVGSEGTLGVFSRITLKLVPPPAAQRAMVAVFDDAERASETVAAIIAAHVVPATLEFMDHFTIRAVEEFSREYRLSIGTFGHAGDGNLHPTILTDKRDREEWERVEQAIAAIFERALALGGTLSGEHGTGIAKARFLEKETSPATILYSQRIKKALDPNTILNPGKIIPAPG
jgi:FAD/FMN-containing dehydrogenase